MIKLGGVGTNDQQTHKNLFCNLHYFDSLVHPNNWQDCSGSSRDD
jgi:hypothetical protein